MSQTGISIFNNGATTRTRGVDVVVSYLTDFGAYGTVNWGLSGNYNTTKLTKVSLGPVQLTSPIALFDQTSVSLLERGSPRVKVIGSAFYTIDKFSVTLRETVYGRTSADYSPDGGIFYKSEVKTAAITDLEVNYRMTSSLTISAGANNLFDKKAPTITLLADGTITDGNNVFDAPLGITPYSINGGYYYARLNFSF